MDIHIDKPILDKPTPEANLAVVHKWMWDTADKLNFFIAQVNKERKEKDNG